MPLTDRPPRQRARPPAARPRHLTSVALSADVLAELDARAEREARSRSWLVEELLRGALGLPLQVRG